MVDITRRLTKNTCCEPVNIQREEKQVSHIRRKVHIGAYRLSLALEYPRGREAEQNKMDEESVGVSQRW